MSIGRIMTLDVEDGVHRRRDLRLKEGVRWRNGMLTLKKALALLLVVERTGKRRRVLARLGISNENARQTMTETTSDWFVIFPSCVYFILLIFDVVGPAEPSGRH
jgi:hypothetical protein